MVAVIGVARRACLGGEEAGCGGGDTDGDGNGAFGWSMTEDAFEVCLSVGMVNWRDAPKEARSMRVACLEPLGGKKRTPVT